MKAGLAEPDGRGASLPPSFCPEPVPSYQPLTVPIRSSKGGFRADANPSSSSLAGARNPCRRPVPRDHGHLDHRGGPAADPAGPRLLPGRPLLGLQRLRRCLRRFAPARWQAGRSLRCPPDLHPWVRDPDRRVPPDWRRRLGLTLAHVANDAITSMLAILLPSLQERFGLSTTVLALLVATLSFSSSVTQLLFGALADRFGRQPLAAFGLLLSVSLLSLMAVAPTVWTLIGLLLIGGLLGGVSPGGRQHRPIGGRQRRSCRRLVQRGGCWVWHWDR